MKTKKSLKVFINCPYDNEYKPLFFAMIYICIFYGLDPIFAACDESSSDRMKNIVKYMKDSNYAIHDISRIHGDMPRFNMPFELGMYYMHIQESRQNKSMLILEGENNKSDIVISDLSGSEIKCHSNDIELLFKVVRPFLWQFYPDKKDAPQKMYLSYMLECLTEIDTKVKNQGYSNYLDLDFFEFKIYIQEYFDNRF